MLVAMLAFVGQSAMIIVSNAAVSIGQMPQPAMALSGTVHIHDGLAGHVHIRGGNNKAGHVHQGVLHDNDDDDDRRPDQSDAADAVRAAGPLRIPLFESVARSVRNRGWARVWESRS